MTENGEHGATTMRVIAPNLIVVERFDHADTIFQNGLLVFDDAVGRQAAGAFAQRHRAARGVEAQANLLCGANLVVQLRAVGEQVQMIAGRGAAAQDQLGHARQRGDVHCFAIHPRPDGIQRLEPVEQAGIDGDAACKRLVQMMMRVDESRQHDQPAGVNHPIGGGPIGREISRRADGFDHIVACVNRSIFDLLPLRVHRDQRMDVAKEQGGHGVASKWVGRGEPVCSPGRAGQTHGSAPTWVCPYERGMMYRNTTTLSAHSARSICKGRSFSATSSGGAVSPRTCTRYRYRKMPYNTNGIVSIMV